MTGEHSNVFWDCPKLQGFWQNIKEEIDKMVGNAYPQEPVLFLLRSIPKDVYGKDQKICITHTPADHHENATTGEGTPTNHKPMVAGT